MKAVSVPCLSLFMNLCAILFLIWWKIPEVDYIVWWKPPFSAEGEHDVVWFWLEKGKPIECPVCSQYFKVSWESHLEFYWIPLALTMIDLELNVNMRDYVDWKLLTCLLALALALYLLGIYYQGLLLVMECTGWCCSYLISVMTGFGSLSNVYPILWILWTPWSISPQDSNML